MANKTTPPWKKDPPKKAKHVKMTEHEIARARKRAEEAGRRYPNMVDNMAIIKERSH